MTLVALLVGFYAGFALAWFLAVGLSRRARVEKVLRRRCKRWQHRQRDREALSARVWLFTVLSVKAGHPIYRTAPEDWVDTMTVSRS